MTNGKLSLEIMVNHVNGSNQVYTCYVYYASTWQSCRQNPSHEFLKTLTLFRNPRAEYLSVEALEASFLPYQVSKCTVCGAFSFLSFFSQSPGVRGVMAYTTASSLFTLSEFLPGETVMKTRNSQCAVPILACSLHIYPQSWALKSAPSFHSFR